MHPSYSFLTGLAIILVLVGCSDKTPQQSNTQFFVENSHQEQWTEAEIKGLKSLSLQSLPALKVDPSNQFDQQPAAIVLGEKLFFDSRFSQDGSLSCASCHQQEKGFTDGLDRAKGVNQVGRNTQTLIGMAWQRWFYWDGRRDSLWSQALVPFEAADEMGSSRLAVLRAIASDETLNASYQKLFGALPVGLLNSISVKQAGPWGDTNTRNAWFALDKAKRQVINQAYVNVGKAVAAYVNTLIPEQARFDQYVNRLTGNTTEPIKNVDVSDDELAGMRLFMHPTKTRCLQCHNGALLTNGSFHNVGSGVFYGQALDFGRSLGLRGVLIDEFNCLGQYSDARPEQCMALRFLNRSAHVPLEGSFKTPTLRELTKTGPYFHDGRYKTLEEVVNHYQKPPADNGPHELVGAELTDKEVGQLVAFLKMLSSE